MKILNAITDQFVENKEKKNKWDHFFLGMAKYISSASKDPSTKVGAVLVGENNLIVGLGYNGFPRGVEDSEERLHTRDLKYKFVVHAEVNAIIMAGNKARGASMYVWPSFMIPCICHDCCKTAIQAGVAEVVGYQPEDLSRAERWKDSIEVAKAMCDEAGVRYRGV